MNRYSPQLFVIFLLTAVGCANPESKTGTYPRKPVKIIVPFDAGGGSDTFTRIIQQAVQQEQLLSQPLVVINVPGAGGSIGARRVKNSRPDGYTILQLHEGMLTNRYSGNSNFGPEAFTPIAGTGQMAHVIAVRDDSPFGNLSHLLKEAADKPDSVIFGVGIGAPSHFAGMMLENAYTQRDHGAKFRFTQAGGGAKRFASLLGGHSDVTTFSVAEFLEFRASGIRALAILTKERNSQLPDVATAGEQGIEVASANMHFWWAPKGTSTDRVSAVSEALRKALELEQVQSKLAKMATDPVFISRTQLKSELEEREERIRAVSQREVQAMPNFGAYILISTLLLSGIVLYRSRAQNAELSSNDEAAAEYSRPLQFSVALMIFIYVTVLQLGVIDYRSATFIFILAVGGVLRHQRQTSWIPIIATALLLSVGLHVIFTQIFVIDLP